MADQDSGPDLAAEGAIQAFQDAGVPVTVLETVGDSPEGESPAVNIEPSEPLTPAQEAIEELKAASDAGLYRFMEVRPQVKLQPGAPKIAVAIPMGDKDDRALHVCDHCQKRQFGVVVCDRCEKPFPANHNVRHSGLVPIEWILTFWGLVPPLLCSMQIHVRKGLRSPVAREQMTHDAIRLGAKYIFYCDDDVILPPKTIYDLHNAMERHPEAGIISGVYVTREKMCEPLIYKQQGQGAYWEFDVTPGHIEEIFAAGAGCMMVRVEALKELERLIGLPWWEDEQDLEALEAGEGKVMWGHDIRFCRRMWELSKMYREVGGQPSMVGPSKPWKVYVAGWIQCLHFDIADQHGYGLPPDAPCFKNTNTKTYWDALWDLEGHGTWRRYPELHARIEQLVPRFSNVADIGCGVGILLERLAKRKQTLGYGYDISERAIGLMQERLIDGEAVDVSELDLNHFPEGEPFTVVCTETIEHLDDLRFERCLEQTSRADLALFSTPEGHLEGTPPGEHVREFSAESLAEALRPYFSEVEIERVEPHFLLAVCRDGRKVKCAPISSGSEPTRMFTG